jgi:hypothetical protein
MVPLNWCMIEAIYPSARHLALARRARRAWGGGGGRPWATQSVKASGANHHLWFDADQRSRIWDALLYAAAGGCPASTAGLAS